MRAAVKTGKMGSNAWHARLQQISYESGDLAAKAGEVDIEAGEADIARGHLFGGSPGGGSKPATKILNISTDDDSESGRGSGSRYCPTLKGVVRFLGLLPLCRRWTWEL